MRVPGLSSRSSFGRSFSFRTAQQVQRHYRRLAEVSFEQIALDKAQLYRSHPLSGRFSFASAMRCGSMSMPTARDTILTRRHDGDAPVATAQVVEHIALLTFASRSISATTSAGVGL